MVKLMDFTGSRKFIVFAVSVVLYILNSVLGKPLNDQDVWTVIGLIVAWMVSQGIADAGSSKAQVDNAKAVVSIAEGLRGKNDPVASTDPVNEVSMTVNNSELGRTVNGAVPDKFTIDSLTVEDIEKLKKLMGFEPECFSGSNVKSTSKVGLDLSSDNKAIESEPIKDDKVIDIPNIKPVKRSGRFTKSK